MTKNDIERAVRKIQKAAFREDIGEVTKIYAELREEMSQSINDMPEQHRAIAMVMLRGLDKEVSEMCNKIRLQEIIDELESDIIDHDLSVANSVLDRFRIGNI